MYLLVPISVSLKEFLLNSFIDLLIATIRSLLLRKGN